MSAPGRPKRESLTRSGKASPIDAPGRPKRESFGSDGGKASLVNAPGRPKREVLSALREDPQMGASCRSNDPRGASNLNRHPA